MPPQKATLASFPSTSDESCHEDCTNPEITSKVISSPTPIISPPATLCTLVMIDMISVSLVVPLLHQYYKNAGVHSAHQREMLSSLFSSSQIVGGVAIGALSDLGMLSRRRVLFLSFLGSAVSYALIIGGGLRQLICSRVIVGLVKQTMTVSTSLMAQYTDTTNRTVWMGRLGASTTAAWIVGPSIGAILYRHVGEYVPAAAAGGLFLVNSLLAAVLLPSDDTNSSKTKNDSSCGNDTANVNKKKLNLSSFFANLKTCFSSSTLASVVISLLLYGWVARTTSYANMASFYEEKYGIEPYARGYIKSYQQGLNLLVQSFFVRTLLSVFGGERNSACIAAFALSLATLCEVHATFPIFACLVCPIVATSVEMISVSLRSLLTQVTPKESLGSVLAAMDVLQNAASVTVPFYRTVLFRFLVKNISGKEDEDASMMGDPDPRVWLLSSFVHWAGFATLVSWLLFSRKHADKDEIKEKKER
ncbi:hypothetical protein HJC23_011390 [Cyclotella cryptica]|uniref:Major facilitator superfamily (MFS) profile domain-containing protein n=1 Tax=Cyclotella cryptica TaxID=29204 RepID=A0ABD3PQY4_9STRA|eukprot:CCRYP_012687-RA/>CCRYP_012687-RA protein AED:0.02 eAED:0.02 QI:0/-1/0/1/-1/1/1/0/475